MNNNTISVYANLLSYCCKSVGVNGLLLLLLLRTGTGTGTGTGAGAGAIVPGPSDVSLFTNQLM
jgi:hypothetical protein